MLCTKKCAKLHIFSDICKKNRKLFRFEGDNVAEISGIEGRFVFGFIDGLLGSDLCAQDDGAFAMPVINTIEHLLQACIFGAVFGVKQIGHNGRLGDDFEEHDPGLLIEDPGTESTTESSQGIGEQFLGIGRSDRERDQ